MGMIFLAVILALWTGESFADPYYNSSESGCNGSDANVLFCEDFETADAGGGQWYSQDCDTANSNGGIGTRTKGWCGTIFANPITPAGAGVCGAGVTPFGNCVGTAGTKSGNARNLAIHAFKTPTCGTNASQKCGVSTIYVRWYAKWLSGYQFGAEKHMNPTDLDGDIAFANVQLNCGSGGSSSTASVYIQVIHGSSNLTTNCNNTGYQLQSGIWYFFEMRITVGASAVIQLWVNDCGANGTTCGAAPILRTTLTGSLPGNANGSLVSGAWLESWANPVSTGTGPYWDQVKASTVGPIGFATSGTPPDTTPPAAPTGVTIAKIRVP